MRARARNLRAEAEVEGDTSRSAKASRQHLEVSETREGMPPGAFMEHSSANPF